jgi:hypothetical protein
MLQFAKQNPVLDSKAKSEALNTLSNDEGKRLKELQGYWTDFENKACISKMAILKRGLGPVGLLLCWAGAILFNLGQPL